MSDSATPGVMSVETSLVKRAESITGAPYSAQTVTERIQTLADGNRIVESVTGSIARDKEGRTRREESLPGLGAGTGQAPQIVMIDDPVGQIHWSLDAATKTAIKMPTGGVLSKIAAESGLSVAGVAAGPVSMMSRTVAIPAGAVPAEGVRLAYATKVSAESEVKRTDLGSQNIEGVMAQGTRVTHTIPAGQVGNDMPIVITSETWFSPELKVIVMSKSNDPRMGETNYKLTGIQRVEPVASLFQVPDDYTTKDRTINNMNVTVIK